MDTSKLTYIVDPNTVRTDYTVIENIDVFKCELPPKAHPESLEYTDYWSMETCRIVEGIWRPQFGKYRYMTGYLYYFANWFVLKHTVEERGQKVEKFIKPILVDYVWDIAYMFAACFGFSGFADDEVYSCHKDILLYKAEHITEKHLHESCFNSKGEIKEYVNAFDYLKQLHDKPLGQAIYLNQPFNFSIFGSRGGGKSYGIACLLEYNFLTAGAKNFDQFLESNLSIDQVVGSADSDKSSDLLSKMKDSIDAKGLSSNKEFVDWFGIYGEEGEKNFTPSPFYTRTLGSLACPNKHPSKTFRSTYKIKKGGEWKEKRKGSKIFHVNYSDKKGTGSQAASGGRYYLSIVEEQGLVRNIIKVHTVNEGATSRLGVTTGVNGYLGTSGNLKYVLAAKKMFLNPQDYKIMSFENLNGKEGKNNRTGFFLPFYMTLFKYKDENGNTNYEEAIADVNRQRREKAEADDPSVLREFLMFKPCYTHEMWISDTGYYLPYEEAVVRERELTAGNLYKEIMTPVELVWDRTKNNGVDYKILHDVEPITDLVTDAKKLKNPSGCIVIYEWPEPNAPSDMYQFVGHDPYVEEDIERGGSLGVTYMVKNPKYIPFGSTGNIIVASYIGKPIKGLDYYYEQQEKLLAFYGCESHSLWYEGNKGEFTRNYYMNRNKLNLLCLTPQRAQGKNIYQRHITSTGVIVGASGSTSKKNLLKLFRDWLLEPTTFLSKDGDVIESKLNIQRVPCLFLIRQIIAFNLDENFDGVSAMLPIMIGMKEYESAVLEKDFHSQESQGVFSYLLNKTTIFKKNENKQKRFFS